jgi:hypothetical protein
LLYASIVRRSAVCASLVIESASSRMITLKGGQACLPPASVAAEGAPIARCAKVFTFVRMTAMPRSSDALSSSTRALKRSGP